MNVLVGPVVGTLLTAELHHWGTSPGGHFRRWETVASSGLFTATANEWAALLACLFAPATL